jgi:hypothetical protein
MIKKVHTISSLHDITILTMLLYNYFVLFSKNIIRYIDLNTTKLKVIYILLFNVLLFNEILSQPTIKNDSTINRSNHGFSLSTGIISHQLKEYPNTCYITLSYDYRFSKKVLGYFSVLYQIPDKKGWTILKSNVFYFITLEIKLFKFQLFDKEIKPYFDIGYGSGSWHIMLPNVGCGFETSLNDKIKILSGYKYIQLVSAYHMISLGIRYQF